MIYLDNAASTWPKPKGVADAVKQAIEEYGANPGRGNHQLARRANQAIAHTRQLLTQLLGIKDPSNLLFFANTTQALNQAIKGLVRPGDHVILTGWEHNAVARPVAFLQQKEKVQVTYLSYDAKLGWAKQVEQSIQENTRLIVTIHGSNVSGEILPIEEIGEVARKHGVFYLVDAAQTAGLVPIHVEQLPIDLLAFPGHKSLFGPQGTGGLYVHESVPLEPMIQGGTGSRSEELQQPVERPTGFESGTPNTPGIAGLGAGVQFILETGIEKIYEHEMKLLYRLWEGLSNIREVQLYTLEPPELPIVSFNLSNVSGTEVAMILDQHYQIAVRAGLHCAFLAHQQMKTEQIGAVRVSPGYFNTETDIDQFIQAIREISQAFA
ncbi:aminotransferase class V-fold PLP-dependent enzyme [Thermoflavimicrobium dichotomicum]|uniref:cysteine desulfurase n=1 Tax=Thermoflavimicrobium dichotomicum TaxID=46223 RepID=A0A1I3KCU8_9BACL|nr:aminotransferase class V-fold PLP-dependent enzyme [Thermoflavimicrobium dichotomicum]SFI70170.1 cysteine desulfurase family protein [Thermoflavimicrobium dichotomicum]